MKNIPTFENFLVENTTFNTINEGDFYSDYKDRERITDIIKKAGGSEVKELKLAQTMANSIKEYEKAVARAEASVDLKKYELAQVFIDRAKALPATDNGYPLHSVMHEVEVFMLAKKNKENYEAHLKGIETQSDVNTEGVFYNVGIPTLHKQSTAEGIKLFRYALIRIIQNLVGQSHVWVMPMSYDETKGELVVKVSPNFTHPKAAVSAAFKEYPKVLAGFLNDAYGEKNIVIPGKGEVTITKDLNYQALVKAVALSDIKKGTLKIDE
jgi:hypothetical protein